MALFKPKKSKPQNLRKKEIENDEDDDGLESKIEDIREIQRTRERKNGLTEIECAVGIRKAATLIDGMQVQGGTMAMTNKQKAKLEAAGIEAGIRDQFAKESLLRDEHEELKRYIDAGLKQIGDGDEPSSSAPEELIMSVLQKAANKLQGFKSKEENELLSENMLAGIPEVDLGINARISNILETEKKKKDMIQRIINPDAFKDEEPKPKRRRFRRDD